MPGTQAELLQEVATYYADKLAQHGQTPQGVDWNGEPGQVLRFEQLAKVVAATGPVSVNDLGCGYGALFEYLRPRHAQLAYLGIDVSAEMVEAARQRHGQDPAASFLQGAVPHQPADYGIASGIFNVRLGRSDAEWQAYLEQTLEVLDATSRRGFAFNCLTSYSDAHKMRDHLYYADPGRLFDLCKRRFSRNVALLHDYDLYEFTLIVRKSP